MLRLVSYNSFFSLFVRKKHHAPVSAVWMSHLTLCLPFVSRRYLRRPAYPLCPQGTAGAGEWLRPFEPRKGQRQVMHES
jgi:hypothetical protein